MKLKSLLIAAVLAVAFLVLAHPAHAQCSALTLTANGAATATVSPGSKLTLAGTVSNCTSQAADVSVTFTVTHNGTTVSTDTFRMQAGESRPISDSFEMSKAGTGTYVVTATSSNGGRASATVDVQ